MLSKMGKTLMYALAFYGFVSILFSIIWIHVMYRTPSVGYTGTGQMSIYDDDYKFGAMYTGHPVATEGHVHITRKEFYDNAKWAAGLTNIGGVILILCACIHNKYTRHGHFIYAITALFNCITILVLTVFFILLALGCQGKLDWKAHEDLPMDEHRPMKGHHGEAYYREEYQRSKKKERPIQCGILMDFAKMYGRKISNADWVDMQDAECESYYGIEEKEERDAKYYTCFGDSRYGDSGPRKRRQANGQSTYPTPPHNFPEPKTRNAEPEPPTPPHSFPEPDPPIKNCPKDLREMLEIKAQMKRVMIISSVVASYGMISLLLTLVTIPAALKAWQLSGNIEPTIRLQPVGQHPPDDMNTRLPSTYTATGAPVQPTQAHVPSYVQASQVQPSYVPELKSTQHDTEDSDV